MYIDTTSQSQQDFTRRSYVRRNPKPLPHECQGFETEETISSKRTIPAFSPPFFLFCTSLFLQSCILFPIILTIAPGVRANALAGDIMDLSNGNTQGISSSFRPGCCCNGHSRAQAEGWKLLLSSGSHRWTPLFVCISECKFSKRQSSVSGIQELSRNFRVSFAVKGTEHES